MGMNLFAAAILAAAVSYQLLLCRQLRCCGHTGVQHPSSAPFNPFFVVSCEITSFDICSCICCVFPAVGTTLRSCQPLPHTRRWLCRTTQFPPTPWSSSATTTQTPTSAGALAAPVTQECACITQASYACRTELETAAGASFKIAGMAQLHWRSLLWRCALHV